MKNHKGFIPALLTLGLVLVGSFVTIGISFLTSTNKIASNPRAANPCVGGAYALMGDVTVSGSGCAPACGGEDKCQECTISGITKYECKNMTALKPCTKARTYASLKNCVDENPTDGNSKCTQCLLGYTPRIEYGGSGPQVGGGSNPGGVPGESGQINCPYGTLQQCTEYGCDEKNCVHTNCEYESMFRCLTSTPIEGCENFTCDEYYPNNGFSKNILISTKNTLLSGTKFYLRPDCGGTVTNSTSAYQHCLLSSKQINQSGCTENISCTSFTNGVEGNYYSSMRGTGAISITTYYKSPNCAPGTNATSISDLTLATYCATDQSTIPAIEACPFVKCDDIQDWTVINQGVDFNDNDGIRKCPDKPTKFYKKDDIYGTGNPTTLKIACPTPEVNPASNIPPETNYYTQHNISNLDCDRDADHTVDTNNEENQSQINSFIRKCKSWHPYLPPQCLDIVGSDIGVHSDYYLYCCNNFIDETCPTNW